jgi:hypothetical protein
MNVFVLCTGRSGSTTFIKACAHISNYTSAHESRTGMLGELRFDYPSNHIEADNRLAWFLGRLDRHYGQNAVYVHLRRTDEDTARSFVSRFSGGIIAAYRKAILMGLPENSRPMDVSLDYCDTVNSNIGLFLKDKFVCMDFRLENAKDDFQRFWEFIGAEGDLEAALVEFDINYNATPLLNEQEAQRLFTHAPLLRAARKLKRVAKKMPAFIRDA